jgi:hypothetical protein
MKRNLKIKLIFRSFAILLVISFTSQIGFSQELFVGPGSEFYLMNNMDFTTSNTVVTVDLLGEFSVEAGNNWGSDQEYVDGKVTAYGSGETKIPIGNDGIYAAVFANHTGNVSGFYSNSNPTGGSNGVNVTDVADVEYWQLTGNAIVTLPWNPKSEITSLVNDNGVGVHSVAVVGLESGTWNLVSLSGSNVVTGNLLDGNVTSDPDNAVVLSGFSQFTFGIDDQAALAVDDLILSNSIRLLSNPVEANEPNIQFTSSNDMINLEVTLYDIMGRKLQTYSEISTANGVGSVQKPNLKSGIYLLKFDHEGKQGVKKIIIE